MSKLNPKNTQNVVKVAARRGETIAVSANGNIQFAKEPLQQLYELAVTGLYGKDSFYASSSAQLNTMRALVKKAVEMDALNFVANLALHARTEMNIRTFPIMLVVEFLRALREQNKNFKYARRLVTAVIQRADQITDLYSYALSVFGNKKQVPMAIKRGVADAFNKFDEYQFAKYDRKTELKLSDVLRIVHPVATTPAQGELFRKIMSSNLALAETWETALSLNGQKSAAERLTPAQLWEGIVSSKKMGYMATLRNLRNIHEAGVSESTTKMVASFISNDSAVARSRQLPFDFVEAHRAVARSAILSSAVERALDLSTANVPQLGERVWIIVDYSGSMGNGWDTTMSTATLLCASLMKANTDARRLAVTVFGSNAKTLPPISGNKTVLEIQRELLSHRRGGIAGSTNFGAALREKGKLGFDPDTVIVITDGEVNSFPYSLIKNFSPSTVRLTVNMSARPSTPMSHRDGWFAVAGWSPALFKWVPAMRSKETIVDLLNHEPTFEADVVNGAPEKSNKAQRPTESLIFQ